MNEGNQHIYEFGPFRLDVRKRLLWRAGEIVTLTPKAFDTLLALVEANGQVVEKDKLMQRVWPNTAVEEGNLTFNISSLRKTLGDDPRRHEYIVTIPGEGYQFVAGVHGEFDELELKERTRIIIEELPATEDTHGSSTLDSRIRSIAVLPFKPLVAAGRDEVLEMGMADTLITALSNIRALSVRPMSAVRQYANIDQDAVAAGREQLVDAVLDGSLQKAGDKVRVTVRLLRIADDTVIWAGHFDERFKDIFSLQDAISQRVVGTLKVQLTGEEKEQLTKRYTDNSEAYQLYLKGRYHWSRFYTAESARKGIEYFNKAIDKDPNYALPYVGLADAYILLGESGAMPVKEAYPKAREMTMRALEKDDKLAEAHVSLAAISRDYDWNWPEAELHFKRAIELNPNSPEARQLYGLFLAYIARSDESVAEAERAVELDPLSPQRNVFLGEVLYVMRRYDQAIEQLRKTLELESNHWFAHFMLGLAYTQKGMSEQAISELQKARELSGNRMDIVGVLGYAYARRGQRGEARKLLNELHGLSKRQYVPPISIAIIYIGLGDKYRAFESLGKVFEDRQWHVWLLRSEPLLDPLRSDPRFAELLKRAGFAP